jgi:hypothetical protein
MGNQLGAKMCCDATQQCNQLILALCSSTHKFVNWKLSND